MTLAAWSHTIGASTYAQLAITYSNVEEIERRRASKVTSPTDVAWYDLVSTDLSRYLLVRSAGFLEATRNEAALDYVRRKSSAKVHRHVRAGMGKGLGAMAGQLKGFMNGFDPSLGPRLSAFLTSGTPPLESEINAMVSSRKLLAHGLSDSTVAATALTRCEAAVDTADHIVRAFQVA